MSITRSPLILLVTILSGNICLAATAGKPTDKELPIAAGNRAKAVIIASPDAGDHEKQAANDLAKYIEMMTGAKLEVANTSQAIQAALQTKTPKIVLGQQAVKLQPNLRSALNPVLKKKPHLRTDGIVLKREGNRVYVAGNNDLSHYLAVAELLRLWGCRWYMPTNFGECIPNERELTVGELDHVYSSPFEIRSYWISWIGDNTGARDFQMRNMMCGRSDLPPSGHALGKYTKGLGKGTFHFPITDPATARHVAGLVDKMYADAKNFSLGMEDGSYDSDNAKDQKLMKLQWDKYFLRWSVTDPMLELYNNVAGILQKK